MLLVPFSFIVLLSTDTITFRIRRKEQKGLGRPNAVRTKKDFNTVKAKIPRIPNRKQETLCREMEIPARALSRITTRYLKLNVLHKSLQIKRWMDRSIDEWIYHKGFFTKFKFKYTF